MVIERNGIRIETFENGRIIEMAGVRDFDPDQIFDCGQCFRWEKVRSLHEQRQHTPEKDKAMSDSPDKCTDEKVWRGIVKKRIAELKYDKTYGILRIEELQAEDGDKLGLGKDENDVAKETSRDNKVLASIDFWWNYLDMDRDYGAIKKQICEGDDVMKEAAEYGKGIRILRQNFWEALVSFIISQNNNIPRIKKCINSLATALGEPVPIDVNACQKAEDVDCYYSIPRPEILAEAEPEDIAACSLGYRDKYLIEAAKQYMEWGVYEGEGSDSRINSSGLLINSTAELERFCGVGPKVANCVGLFGLGMVDSFPIDVWMRRVMHRLYGIPENDLKAMKKYAEEHFTPYGGIAQQYLFYFITHAQADDNKA